MPKLPDKMDLGGMPGVSISGPGTPPVYRGGEIIGRAVEKLGAGISSAADVMIKKAEKDQALDAATRFADFQYKLSEEYRNRVENLQPGATGFRQGIVDTIDGAGVGFLKSLPPEQQKRYAPHLINLKRQYSASADTVELRERDRYGTVVAKDSINKLALGIENSPSLYSSNSSAINSVIQNANVSPITRNNLQRDYSAAADRALVEGTLRAGGSAADARMVIWKRGISTIESGGRYDLLGPVTKSGDRAYGKYQVMGSNIAEWTKAALGKSLTKEEFLRDPVAQEKVFEHRFGGYVKKYGNAEEAARAWFAGEGGRNKLGRKDILGTSVADYSRKFTNIAGELSDFTEKRILHYQGKATAERSTVKKLMEDDLTSIINTGVGLDDKLTPERVKAAVGEDGLASWASQREYAAKYFQGTKDIDETPTDLIYRQLDYHKPTPGTEGFKKNQALYNNLVKHAQATIKLRETDPATAVEKHPFVVEALKTGNPIEIGKARISAQTSIGIPSDEVTPITKAQADDYLTPLLTGVVGNERKLVAELVNRLNKEHGPHADEALRYIMRASKMKKDISKQVGFAVKRIGLGDAFPSQSSGKMPWNPEPTPLGGLPSQKSEENGFEIPLPDEASAPIVKGGITPPPEAVQALFRFKDNPAVVANFDKKYGAGSAKKLFEGVPGVSRAGGTGDK